MAVRRPRRRGDGTDGGQPGGRRRAERSSRPRYPAWLTVPSFIYYAIFFLGPMAILVAFSLATQKGFGSLTYGFDLSQYQADLASRCTSRSSSARWSWPRSGRC